MDRIIALFALLKALIELIIAVTGYMKTIINNRQS